MTCYDWALISIGTGGLVGWLGMALVLFVCLLVGIPSWLVWLSCAWGVEVSMYIVGQHCGTISR